MQCVQVTWLDPGTWVHSAHPVDALELHEMLQVGPTHPLLQEEQVPVVMLQLLDLQFGLHWLMQLLAVQFAESIKC